jgi:hypothetical protein
MSEKPLDADDFPVGAENRKLVTHDRKQIAGAKQRLAQEIADRLNEHAAHKEEDRWAL